MAAVLEEFREGGGLVAGMLVEFGQSGGQQGEGAGD